MAFPSFASAACGMSASAIAGLLFALPAQASDALAGKHGCLGCHAKASTLVGPSYQAIAERYAGQADAAAMLSKKIRAGWPRARMAAMGLKRPALGRWAAADPVWVFRSRPGRTRSRRDAGVNDGDLKVSASRP